MAERTKLIDGKLHRLKHVAAPWWKRIIGVKTEPRWLPLEPEFTA